jgi:hypothetical protein
MAGGTMLLEMMLLEIPQDIKAEHDQQGIIGAIASEYVSTANRAFEARQAGDHPQADMLLEQTSGLWRALSIARGHDS